VPGLGSAQPIACDATAGSDLDAVAASRTMGGEEADFALYLRVCRASGVDRRVLRAVARRAPAGPPKAGGRR